MVIRYISDLHFGHERIMLLDKRPYNDIQHMDRSLIDNWNSVVHDGDLTYILGDFCWDKDTRWIEILRQLKGDKVLIRGNHDLSAMSSELRSQFRQVLDYAEIKDNGRHVVLSHYPLLFYKNAPLSDWYMLCGHVHTTRENDFLEQWREQLRNSCTGNGENLGQIYNVGCMMPYMDYKPRTLDEIVSAFE